MLPPQRVFASTAGPAESVPPQVIARERLEFHPSVSEDGLQLVGDYSDNSDSAYHSTNTYYSTTVTLGRDNRVTVSEVRRASGSSHQENPSMSSSSQEEYDASWRGTWRADGLRLKFELQLATLTGFNRSYDSTWKHPPNQIGPDDRVTKYQFKPTARTVVCTLAAEGGQFACALANDPKSAPWVPAHLKVKVDTAVGKGPDGEVERIYQLSSP